MKVQVFIKIIPILPIEHGQTMGIFCIFRKTLKWFKKTKDFAEGSFAGPSQRDGTYIDVFYSWIFLLFHLGDWYPNLRFDKVTVLRRNRQSRRGESTKRARASNAQQTPWGVHLSVPAYGVMV